MIGHTIAERYYIEREIGRGGFATVYLAMDTRLNRPVALKLLARREEAFIKQFAREAQAVARLNHPHIISISDYGNDGTGYFLIMPYLPGGDLAARLAERGQTPYPAAEALPILSQIAAALDYAHSHNVIHRDVKPANILFDDKGQAILTDFGLVKAAASAAQPGSTWMLQWDSDKNSLAGTLAYMAPEQTMLGRPVGKPADVYALGVVAYELLTGAPPFRGDTDAVAEAHRSQPPPDPRQRAPGLPRATAQLLQQALAKEENRRPAHAGQFAAQLAETYYGDAIEAALAQGDYQKALADALTFQRQFPESGQGAKWVEQAEAAIQTRARQLEREATHQATERERRAKQEAAEIIRQARKQTENRNFAHDAPPDVANKIIRQVRNRNWPTWGGAIGLLLVGCLLLFMGVNWLANANREPEHSKDADNTRQSEIDGMIQVLVPVGVFRMGRDNDLSSSNERPIRAIYLDAFWIDQTEVTNQMYAQCVDAGACALPSQNTSYTRRNYYHNRTYADYPVIHVSWHNADNYCQWVGRRLPTEAEWEKAARGTDDRTYPWGEAISCEQANYRGAANNTACVGDTTAVGSYPASASPYGALDMAGNVWEWVADWYDTYPATQITNPTGPTSGEYKALRGGSWLYDAQGARTSHRIRYAPGYRGTIVGFRCASSVP